MHDFEKLGVFYLGRSKADGRLLLYESRQLVTHAVCVGMTGSGKTGLCVGLLEEAAIDDIPALIIDPKGDLSNLLLTFPQLRPEDFAPWVNEDEAQRKGIGSLLLRQLLQIAQQLGLTYLHGDMLPENYAIQRLIRTLGVSYTATIQAGTMYICVRVDE